MSNIFGVAYSLQKWLDFAEIWYTYVSWV